jgi:hypothetical protein
MLAEELVQHAHHAGRDAADLAGACRAAQVFCRLHALHADEEYTAAAVVVPGARYRDAAARLLARHAARARESVGDAAAFGLALAEWLGLH